MLFNTSRPTTEQTLATLFTGNPHVSPEEVGSNIFLNASQGYGYLQDQGQKLGIGDPVEYYKQKQLAQTMASTPSGAQMEMMRQTGQFSPNSLPGQLAARDKMWTAAGDQATQQAQQIAALQNQNNLKAYPLPVAGVQPTLSPAMQTAMQQEGFTDPRAWLLNKRLGANHGMVAPFNQVAPTGVDADALFNEPSFQNVINAQPGKAGQVFNALTGHDLAAYAQNYQKSKDSERQFKVKTLRDMLAEGKAQYNQDGTLSFRKLVADPSGRLVPSTDFGPGDAFQQGLAKVLPYADSDLARYTQLAAKGGSVQVAPLQAGGGVSTDSTPRELQAGSAWAPSGVGGMFVDALKGMGADISRIGHGQAQSFTGAPAAGDFGPAGGRAIRHAAPILRNNPQFQQLLRTNPEKARRLILAIQMSEQNAAPVDESYFDASGYNPSY